jgi:hypothetical protein
VYERSRFVEGLAGLEAVVELTQEAAESASRTTTQLKSIARQSMPWSTECWKLPYLSPSLVSSSLRTSENRYEQLPPVNGYLWCILVQEYL